MKSYLFFGYREWAIDIFNMVKNPTEKWTLVCNSLFCNRKYIDSIKPDIIFFYGWSNIVPSEIVNNYMCLCLHPSPLPKYRGGSPIQNQVIAGEKTSAVTIFRMTEDVDRGEILFQEAFPLDGYLSEILERIKGLGYSGTRKIINRLNDDYMGGLIQNEINATIFKRRSPKQSEIKPTEYDAKYCYDMIRCLQPPYPEAFIKCKEGRLIIEKARYEI